MSVYQRHGKVPHKRHIVFRQPNGELYHEELFGTEALVNYLTKTKMLSQLFD